MRLLTIAIASIVVAAVAAPDFAAAGCGGGHRRQHGGDATTDNGGANQGGHHRRNANPNGRDGGWGDGHGGRRGRHDHTGGTDVDIGVSATPTQRYGRGRIGPPTACQEIAALQEDLGKLFQLRVQVNSGKRLVTVQNGHQRVISTRGYRQALNASLASGKGTVDQNVYGWEQLDDMMRDAREQSLAAIDSRISATQARMAQLEYQCQE